MATLDTSWLPPGMDPKCSYLLEIRLVCNPKKCRKDVPCFRFSKVVDHLSNFKDLVTEITDQYPHGYLEIVHVFYYDEAQKCFPKVTTDQELLEMFRKHVDSKVVHMTIMYTDPTDVVPIPECYTPENSELLDIPCTPSMACPSLGAASQSMEPTCSQPTKPAASGYKCVVNLEERTCSCRKWQVSGIPCKHVIAFVTFLREPLEKYVDMYYSIEKFKAANEALIPAMPDKAQWPQSNHGFFMHPPLLKSTTGRRQNQRFKGCTEGNSSTTRKKGSHQCRVCKKYGHRWYKCKDGDPEDIAALLEERVHQRKGRKRMNHLVKTTLYL